MAIVETDLGWAAEEDYLVHDAGTVLGTLDYMPGLEREFLKSNNGYAITAFVYDTVNGWYGPYLLSTEYSNASYGVRVGGGNIYPQTPGWQVRHYKRTWYVNTNGHVHEYGYTTSFPYLEFSTGSETQNALAILDIAGAQLYRTDKTWSFLAGMMCGLSGRALPKIGV